MNMLRNLFGAAALGIALLASSAQAQFYWSGNAVTQGGSGTWTTTGLNFGSSAGGPYNLASNGNANNNFFGGTPGTVTVSGAITTRQLQFDVSGYLLTGGTLTRALTTGNDIIVTGTGDATINSDFSLGSGNRVLKQGGNTLMLGGWNNRGIDVLSGTVIATSNARIGIPVVSSGATLILNSGTAGNLRLTDGTGTNLTLNNGATLASSNAAGINVSIFAFQNAVGTVNFGNASYTGGITITPNIASTVARTLNVAADTTLTFTGNLSGAAGSYTKTGAGKLLFNGNNTYTGATTISGGTFGGTGTMTSAVTVNNGATLSPGASIESLATGALTFNTGSTFHYEIDSSAPLTTAADLQIVNGNLGLNGVVNLTLDDLALVDVPLPNDTTFSLINYSGVWNGGLFTYNGNLLADDSVFTFGANTFLINYNATTGGVNFPGDQIGGSFVNIMAVPEPAGLLLWGMGGGLAFAAVVYRRQLRKSQKI